MNISEENRMNERMIIDIGSQLIAGNRTEEEKNSLMKEFLGRSSLDNKSLLLALERLSRQGRVFIYDLEMINATVVNACIESVFCLEI